MDKKFYYIETCPYCKQYTLYEAGYSGLGTLILHCDNCNITILESDMDMLKIGKEDNEYNQIRQS